MHTAKCRCFSFIVSEETFDLHAMFADPMCFKPVKFCFSNRTILETDRSFPLELAPVALAVKSDQPRQDADTSARRDCLDLSNFAENLESHEGEDTSARF